jgi:hypothetical protein
MPQTMIFSGSQFDQRGKKFAILFLTSAHPGEPRPPG